MNQPRINIENIGTRPIASLLWNNNSFSVVVDFMQDNNSHDFILFEEIKGELICKENGMKGKLIK